MALMDWSVSANSNSVVGSINWSEGQPPSSVNNSARQMMADIADWTSNPFPTFYQADSATYASGTTFVVPGNLTSRYVEGRRVYAILNSGGIQGSILSATFGTNTTVTVQWDSGSLDATLSALKLSLISQAGMPTKGIVQHIDNTVSISTSSGVQGSLTIQNTNTSNYIWMRCSAGAKAIGVTNASVFTVVNSANTLQIMALQDSGAVTFLGDVTASSDERRKSDWEDLPENFIEQLAGIKRSGLFTRDGERHVGVGAQSLMEILREAVTADAEGNLSVAYGNAALATCVVLCREVVTLRKRLEELEGEQ